MWPLFFMPNYDWLLQCVQENMDVSQDFTESPRTWESRSELFTLLTVRAFKNCLFVYLVMLFSYGFKSRICGI